MFILPNLPSPRSEPHELADFAELLCWNRGAASEREIIACQGRDGDNGYNIGADDEDDENSRALDEVMNEIERRSLACRGGYPFRLEFDGTVLQFETDKNDPRSILYCYLLLSTRLNMKEGRIHSEIDGTQLLEEISAHALKNYLGRDRARALVFGTARSGTFKDKVNRLCDELREGGDFRRLDDGALKARDDKLDAVAWAPFSDRLPGQLILFAQCKTGTNWRSYLSQLQPTGFIKNWMSGVILVDPVRAFCISEAADRSKWKSACIGGGILFDRCRLVDFCDGMEPELLDKVTRWTNAAKETVNFGD